MLNVQKIFKNPFRKNLDFEHSSGDRDYLLDLIIRYGSDRNLIISVILINSNLAINSQSYIDDYAKIYIQITKIWKDVFKLHFDNCDQSIDFLDELVTVDHLIEFLKEQK